MFLSVEYNLTSLRMARRKQKCSFTSFPASGLLKSPAGVFNSCNPDFASGSDSC